MVEVSNGKMNEDERDESKREEKAKPVQLVRLVRNNGQVSNKFKAKHDLDKARHREKSHVDVFSILRPLC